MFNWFQMAICLQPEKHTLLLTIHISNIQYFLPSTQTENSYSLIQKVCRAEISRRPQQVGHREAMGSSWWSVRVGGWGLVGLSNLVLHHDTCDIQLTGELKKKSPILVKNGPDQQPP